MGETCRKEPEVVHCTKQSGTNLHQAPSGAGWSWSNAARTTLAPMLELQNIPLRTVELPGHQPSVSLLKVYPEELRDPDIFSVRLLCGVAGQLPQHVSVTLFELLCHSSWANAGWKYRHTAQVCEQHIFKVAEPLRHHSGGCLPVRKILPSANGYVG